MATIKCSRLGERAGRAWCRQMQYKSLSTSIKSGGKRLRRSVHFVPGDNDKYLSSCLSLGADSIVLDLEDSVKNKGLGREKIRSYLGRWEGDERRKETEVLVRINPLSTSLWREDLEAGFYGGADGFMVPKVESREELQALDEVLTSLEKGVGGGSGSSVGKTLGGMVGGMVGGKVVLPIATETPLAVFNILEIAQSPRVCGITWGCEDLSAALGSFRTRCGDDGAEEHPDEEYLDVFRHVRSTCLLAAKAAGVQAIDGIYQHVRQAEGFVRDATRAKHAGFDGKLTLHPLQITALHQVFAPTSQEMQDAQEIVRLWEHMGDDGRGSLEHQGKMIDRPHYLRARNVLARGAARSNHDQPAEQFQQLQTTNEAQLQTTNNAQEKTSNNIQIQTPNKAHVQTPNKAQVQTPNKDLPKDQREKNIANSNLKHNTIDRTNEVFPRVSAGKYYQDFIPGETIHHYLTRTVTESDNVFFTCLTLNPAPIHLDHELAKQSTLKQQHPSSSPNSPPPPPPLFNSMFTLALLVGMSIPETTHGTTVANLGFSSISFPNPVYPGDTLRAETFVERKRESQSRPMQGIVSLRHSAYNQRGELVCVASRQALMKMRP